MAARDDYIVPIEIAIGKRGGLTFQGKNLNKKLREVVEKELSGIEKTKIAGSVVTVNVDAKYLSTKRMGQTLGEYLEFIVYDKLIKKFQRNGAEVIAIGSEEAKFNALIARAKLTSKTALAFKKQTHEAADQAINAIWDQLELTQEDLKKIVEVEWIGDSNPIGDVSLKIGNKRIMIECKNYSDYFLQNIKSGFIQYFQLSDAEGHFPKQFWVFLKDNGFYNLKDPSQKDSWVNKVLTKGFIKYSQDISRGTLTSYKGSGAELFSYLLQKGSKASLNVDQRAIITLDRVKAANNEYHVFFSADLQKLENLSNIDIEAVEHYAKVSLLMSPQSSAKQQEIGNFTIPTNSQKVIADNSIDSNPSKDGEGWTTTFNFVINKTLLNQIQ